MFQNTLIIGKLKPHIDEAGWISGAIDIQIPEKKIKNSGNFVVCYDDIENKEKLEESFDKIIDVKKKLSSRITTGKLSRWLSTILENNPPPLYKGKQNNIRYITQVNVKPPTFAVFMSSPDNLQNSYKRFLAASIMEDFNLYGLPVRIMYRKGNNPYLDN